MNIQPDNMLNQFLSGVVVLAVALGVSGSLDASWSCCFSLFFIFRAD